MKPTNPEEGLPDTELLAVKLEKEGKAPKGTNNASADGEQLVQSEITDEQDEQDATDAFIKSLGEFNIKSLDDLYRLKEQMIQFENKRLYEM